MIKAKDVAEQKAFIESILNIAKNEASDEDKIVFETPDEDEEVVSESFDEEAVEADSEEVVEATEDDK